MNRRPPHEYDDSKLTGLEIAETIAREWESGKYPSVAAVTTAVHDQQAGLPRSAIFWLAYHTISQIAPEDNGRRQPWPMR